MRRRLEKLKKNDRSIESYFEEFCRMAMRVGFVLDSEEKLIQFVDRLRLSIKKKINVEKVLSIEEAYHLALRIKEKKLKRKYGSRQ